MNSTQVDELFLDAMAERTAEARAALLDRACNGNAELREKVDALLVAHDAAGSFLRLPEGEATTPLVPISERPGTTIGRYKLLEQIGEGGFGVVFMADQEQPVRRRVAVKIIKLGMDTKQVVARFEAERQALAMMDHPNIAKVLDAGATDTGRPYFVMELVRGVPITEYCDQARMVTNDRLKLFQSVCSAIQHAHQKGIIHRDLKPSNVLVTLHDDHPVAKVIDFGVAKATQARLTERTLFTEFRQMIGTPSYMSPEQASMSGLDVDTRSDVYSLGVLLYELLTGTTPIDAKQLRSGTYDDIRRLVCEVDPPSPSARLSTLTDDARTVLAQGRNCAPAQLALQLRSDLDWIVMKCLEKNRQRRYESASALSLDLQRYLDGEPVEARSPTKWYRLTKFVRRNKIGVIAGTSIFTALIVGLAVASLGLIQARQQAAVARSENIRSTQVAKFLTDMLSAVRPGVARGQDTGLLREILDRTAERVSADLADQPEVKGDVWSTLAETYAAIDDHQRATEFYEKAVSCYQNSGAGNESKLSMALGSWGRMQTWSGNRKEGAQTAESALKLARKVNDVPTLIHCLQMAGEVQDDPSGSPSKAATPFLEEALQLSLQTPSTRHATAILKALLANHIGATDPDRAISLAQEALQTLERERPQDIEEIAKGNYYLGQIYMLRGDHDHAVRALSEAVKIDRKIYPPGHSGAENPMYQLVESLTTARRVEEGLAVMSELVGRSRDAFGSQHATYLRHLTNYIYFVLRVGCYDKGLAPTDEAIDLSRKLYGPNADATLNLEWQKAQLLRGLHRFSESQKIHEHVQRGFQELHGDDNRTVIKVKRDFAQLLKYRGELDKALSILDALIEQSRHPLASASSHSFSPEADLVAITQERAEIQRRKANVVATRYDDVVEAVDNRDFELANKRIDVFVHVLPENETTYRSYMAYRLATSMYEPVRNDTLALELATKAAEVSKYAEPSALDSLAAACAANGDFESAVKWERKAVELSGIEIRERYRRRTKAYEEKRKWWLNDAWPLATSSDAKIRDGAKALKFALWKVKASENSDPSTLDYSDALNFNTLAAAYAETGDFDSAVKWERKAIDVGRPGQRASFDKYLEYYRNKKRPWVDK